MTFFDPLTVLQHLFGPSVFKGQGQGEAQGRNCDSTGAMHGNFPPLASSGLLVADIALAFEALAILSRQI
jgi:hypothetical protein